MPKPKLPATQRRDQHIRTVVKKEDRKVLDKLASRYGQTMSGLLRMALKEFEQRHG